MADSYIGEIRMMAGLMAGKPPTGWLFCNGTVVGISQYQALFSLIGTTYGGDGVSTFGLPDLRGRLPMGQGPGPGLSARILGQQTGTESVTLTAAQLPAHTHGFQTQNVSATTPTISTTTPMVFANTTSPAVQYLKGGLAATDYTTVPLGEKTLSSAGRSYPHDNVMPSSSMYFIICCVGMYPQRAN